MISHKRALLYLYLVSFLWAFTGPIGKIVSVGIISLLWWRSLLCSIILVLTNWRALYALRYTSKRFVTQVALSGVALTLHWGLFYQSIRLSTIATAMMCLASTSFFVCFVEYFLYGKRVTFKQLLQSLLIIGAFTVIYYKEQYADMKAGFIAGVLAAVINAFYFVLNSRVVQQHKTSAQTIVTAQLLISAGMLSVVLLSVPHIHLFDRWHSLTQLDMLSSVEDVVYMLVLCGVCTVLPFRLFIASYEKVSAFTQSIILNIEPIFGILLGVLFFHEHEMLNLYFYIGCTTIVGLVIYESLTNKTP